MRAEESPRRNPFRWWWVPTLLSVMYVAILGVVLVEVRSALGHWEGTFLIMASAVMYGFLILSGLLVMTWGVSRAIHRRWRKKHWGL